jgi:ribosomal protein L28
VVRAHRFAATLEDPVMARRCTLTRKGVLTEALGETVRLRIATRTLRTIEKRGGLDGFLLATATGDLTGDLARLKRRIAERREKAAA